MAHRRKRRRLLVGAEVDRAHREVMRTIARPFRFTHSKRTHRRARALVRSMLGGR